jgi:flagellar L-ring protein precursor FlgH
MMQIPDSIRLAPSIALLTYYFMTGISSLTAQESSLFRQAPAQAWSPLDNSTGPMTGAQVPTNRLPSSVAQIPTSTSGYGDVGLTSASWTYTPAPPLRTFRIQDIVTIRVDELARLNASGAAQNRRVTLFDAILKDWIAFRDGDLGKDAQSTGDPQIKGESAQLYRADSTLQSSQSLAFNVAARVVDILPNGNLVLEANKTIRINDNNWQTSLTGICRAQDIAPDNVILSRDLLDLQIGKDDKGQLRDGYKRGWLTRWINEFSPF